MGVALKDIIIGNEIKLENLKNKVLAVDSHNFLYQFLTTIRARDGTLLMDSKGNVTSHLVGLFSRTTRLMQYGLRLIFVFDGKPPQLKEKERERRKGLKLEAEREYKKAVEKQDLDAMKKYAARTSKLTPDLISEAKKVIEALGLPLIQAPSEGEAQAAFMVEKGDAYATVSQDFDTLIHLAPLLVRNLSIVGRRKTAHKLSYETVKPELISLEENLNNLGIDKDQLVVLALLVGTDYNIGGIKGIGPKKALELVKKYKKYFGDLFKEAGWDSYFNFPWTDAYYLIKNMEVSKDYKLEWKEIDKEKLIRLLVDKHDFSEERVNNTIKKVIEEKETKKQKGLKDFF